MFCDNCGKKLMDDAAFCPSCGKALNDDIVDTNEYANNKSVPNNNNPYGNAMPLAGPAPNYGQIPNYGQAPVYQPPYVQQPYVQQPYFAPQPTVVNIQPQPIKTKSLNGFCVAGFAVSIAGIFIGALICGIAAVVFSVIGLVGYDENKHDGKWMGLTGIVIGVIDLIIGLFIASIIAALFEMA